MLCLGLQDRHEVQCPKNSFILPSFLGLKNSLRILRRPRIKLGCLSLEAASKLRELRVTDELQSQLDSWATRNSEGVLEAEERQQYEAILRALNFVAVLQAKARHIAEESSGS